MRRTDFFASLFTVSSLFVAPDEHLEAIGRRRLWSMRFLRRMGLQGIVAKRRDSRYRSGRSPD
jgi:hypothetical protein